MLLKIKVIMKGRGASDKFYISKILGFIFNLAYKQYE